MGSAGVGPDQDPSQYYHIDQVKRVQRKEADEDHENPPQIEESVPQKKWGFAISCLLLIKKTLDLIQTSHFKKSPTTAEQQLRQPLTLLSDAMKTLIKENRSQDTTFLKQLSSLWHVILEQSLSIHPHSPLGKQLRDLIQEIENYPKGETTTFGYYLDEYAGSDWLPFPYMELLQELHQNAKSDPSNPLFRWLNLIEDILILLNPE